MSIPGFGIELGLGTDGMRRLWEGGHTCLGVTLEKISASKPRWPWKKDLVLLKLLLKNQELPLLCLENCEPPPPALVMGLVSSSCDSDFTLFFLQRGSWDDSF